MSHSRFNHVFLIALIASAVSAFIIPIDYFTFLRGRFDALLSPVAYPARQLAQNLSSRFSNSTSAQSENPTSSDARHEVDQLRATVASLNLQLDELRRQLGERQSYGDIWKFSRPFKAVGGDSTYKKSLTLRGDSHGLTVGMPVISRQGLVGRISSVGLNSAQARLITEKNFCLTASILRRSNEQNSSVQPISIRPAPLVEGRGDGTLTVTNLSADAVTAAQLQTGDLIVASDPELPTIVFGQPIGKIERIGRLAREPLYAEIIVKPIASLEQLSEVMVVTGDTPTKSLATAR